MKLFREENRMALILKTVESQRSCSIDRLVQKTEVSKKTIQNDIKDLNSLIGGYAVITNKKADYKLIVFNKEGYEEIRDRIYQQEEFFNSPQIRCAYIFWQLMDAKQPYLIDDLAEEMKVGRTTTNADIKRLREMIQDYQIDIKGKANTGLTLEGKERNIRFYLLEQAYEQIYLTYPLGSSLREILYQMQEKYALDALSFGLFFRTFVVMIHRLENGHTIETLEDKYMELLDHPAYQIANEIADQVEAETNLKVSEKERIFLTLPVVGMRTPENMAGIENYIQVSEEAAEVIIEILDRIREELGVTVVVNELFDDFVYHVFFMVNRLKYGFRIHNPIVDDIKDEYSLAFQMAEIAKKVIETKAKVIVSKDEMGYLAAYFGVFLLEQAPMQKPEKVAIVCGSGKIIGRLIANQLKDLFEVPPNIEYFYRNNVETLGEMKFDLIISTIKIEIETKTPIIFTDEVFDKNLLKSKIQSIRYLKKTGMTIRQGIDSLLLNVLDEDRFMVLNSENNYLENMKIMAQALMDQNVVDKNFKERLVLREKESTMVFDEHVAFPHAITRTSKLCLALGVYPETRKEGIKLIIMLGIPKEMENDTILVQLYDEILSMSQNEKIVEEVSKLQSYRELLLYFAENNF